MSCGGSGKLALHDTPKEWRVWDVEMRKEEEERRRGEDSFVSGARFSSGKILSGINNYPYGLIADLLAVQMPKGSGILFLILSSLLFSIVFQDVNNTNNICT